MYIFCLLIYSDLIFQNKAILKSALKEKFYWKIRREENYNFERVDIYIFFLPLQHAINESDIIRKNFYEKCLIKM